MTKLLYLDDFDVVSCQAGVVKVEQYEGRDIVVLNQTCFYPKGGGQDYDQGLISSSDGVAFNVEEVYFVDGEVKHVGSYESGTFSAGDEAVCRVDNDRRQLNTRLHSAGHVIDMAVRSLGYAWHPSKGAHYPHMSFVDYEGELDQDKKEAIKADIQTKVNELIERGTTNHIEFMSPDEMARAGAVVPENLPKDKPSRAMVYDDFPVPCGGTHPKNIKEIGSLNVTKIKMKNGAIHVSYEVSE